MSVRRRDRNDAWNPLMPWEPTPEAPRTQPNAETVSTADRVVLYDAKGQPLTRKRPPLGFRPEDAR